jgi:hypothetical protein
MYAEERKGVEPTSRFHDGTSRDEVKRRWIEKGGIRIVIVVRLSDPPNAKLGCQEIPEHLSAVGVYG